MAEKLGIELSAGTQKWEDDLSRAAERVENLNREAAAASVQGIATFTKEVKEADRELVQLIQTAQQSQGAIQIRPEAIQSFVLARQNAAQASETFRTFGKTATADMQKFGRSMNVSSFAVNQLAFGLQDFIQVLSQPGLGVAAALRATNNNLQQFLALSVGGGVGAVVGLSAAFLPLLFNLLDFKDETKEAKEELDAFRESLAALADEAIKFELGEDKFEAFLRLRSFRETGDPALRRQADLREQIGEKRFELEQAQSSSGAGLNPFRFGAAGFVPGGSAAELQREIVSKLEDELGFLLSDLAGLREQIADREELFANNEQARKDKIKADKFSEDKLEAEKRAEKDRESNLAKQRQGEEAERQNRLKATELVRQREAEAFEARQKKIDSIASELVGTFRDVIQVDGDLEAVTEDLRKVFADLGTDADDLSEALGDAAKMAQQQTQLQRKQQAIVRRAQQQQQQRLATQQAAANVAQTTAQAGAGMTRGQLQQRMAIALREGDPDLSGKEAMDKARDAIQSRLDDLDNLQRTEQQKQQAEDRKEAVAKKGGALTPDEDRDLQRQQKQDRQDLRTRQRARQRGDAPIGADIMRRDNFGEQMGGGEGGGGGGGASGFAQKAGSSMQSASQFSQQATGAFDQATQMISQAQTIIDQNTARIKQIESKFNSSRGQGARF